MRDQGGEEQRGAGKEVMNVDANERREGRTLAERVDGSTVVHFLLATFIDVTLLRVPIGERFGGLPVCIGCKLCLANGIVDPFEYEFVRVMKMR
jgi:hypothetical protein